MTYQVLARKWRPRSFDTLIGQEHVVRALTHALDTQRLHHAWLFTGTRGVGKTTLSRILAKALNCEKGVSAHPCGECRSCVEIDQGRFVDYVELDAASNRGVDEMTQLLEQAVYAPSAARYKVYMIDEVHMLTGHAFNAMLKTLEEPPAHVKFILATTDPQKIPVTVLSRCLQFNLKQMTVPAIEQHLQFILQQETIPAEPAALRLLAQAAQGSMRDALSLTDQAIAYSAGTVSTEAVQGMLGTIDQSHLIQILQALIDGTGERLVAIADDMLLRGLSFEGALADLAVLLSRIAIEQRVPGALPQDELNLAAIEQLAQQLSADHVQLFYSVVVHSRDEIRLAPDDYAGFIMACLRLLALTPAGSLPTPVRAMPDSTPAAPTSSPAPEPEKTAPDVAPMPEDSPSPVSISSPIRSDVSPDPEPRTGIQPAVIESGGAVVKQAAEADLPPWETEPSLPVQKAADLTTTDQAVEMASSASEVLPKSPEPSQMTTTKAQDSDLEPPPYDEPPLSELPEDAHFTQGSEEDFSVGSLEDGDMAPLMDEAVQQAVAALDLPTTKRLSPEQVTAIDWVELATALPLSGWAAELAQQTEWVSFEDNVVVLRAAIRSADDSQAKARINTVLNEHFGRALQLHIEYGDTGSETAFAQAEALRQQRQEQAENDAQQNPFILALEAQFDAQIVTGSIRAK